MAEIRKTWILAPVVDYSPNGPIALGNIIKSYAYPDDACNEDTPPFLMDVSRPNPTERFELEVKKDRSVGGGLFAKFLEMLGGSLGNGEASMDFGRSGSRKYTCEKVEKRYFKPSIAYVEEAIKSPGVQKQLKASYWNNSLYMITGIAVAKGASILSKDISNRGYNVQVGVDLQAVAGAPAKVGPKGHWSSTKETSTSSGRMPDFIIAYRLIKFKVDRYGKVTMREETKGALFSRDDPSSRKPSRRLEKEDYKINMQEFTSRDTEAGIRIDVVDVVDDDGERLECIAL